MLLPLGAGAQVTEMPNQVFYSEGSFTLENGESTRNFKISYIKHGSLSADKSNAILMTSSLGGNVTVSTS
ncbi:MAG: hypothetical protein NVSMB5_03020 [Candidatus Velthaea sp.]